MVWLWFLKATPHAFQEKVARGRMASPPPVKVGEGPILDRCVLVPTFPKGCLTLGAHPSPWPPECWYLSHWSTCGVTKSSARHGPVSIIQREEYFNLWALRQLWEAQGWIVALGYRNPGSGLPDLSLCLALLLLLLPLPLQSRWDCPRRSQPPTALTPPICIYLPPRRARTHVTDLAGVAASTGPAWVGVNPESVSSVQEQDIPQEGGFKVLLVGTQNWFTRYPHLVFKPWLKSPVI